MPHKWRYNILPFIPSPSPSPSTNFAPEAFHRNGFQETLSFDPELQGQIVTDEEEKKEKSLRGPHVKTVCLDVIYVWDLTHCVVKVGYRCSCVKKIEVQKMAKALKKEEAHQVFERH